jgi:hypothetical protein
LAVANGGTGATSLTANNVILGNGTSAVQVVAPGTVGNVLTSNGTTWASSAASSGGLTYIYTTTSVTATDKQGVLADTSAGAFTVTLPATPSTGAQVVVADAGANWGTNNLTVGRNGSTIGGLAQDLVCDLSGVSVQFVYDGATWEVYAQVGGQGGNAVTLDGVQTLTNKTLTDPKIVLGGTNGTAGQALVSQGAGVAPAWATVGSSLAVVARTSNTILGASDQSKLFACTGTFTQTLTAAATLGNGWYCYLRNTGNGTITVDPNGAELIDGAATYALLPGFTVILTCNGTGFTVVGLVSRTYPNMVQYTVAKGTALSGTFTVPADTYVIRAYAFGAGGNGAATNSGGGGGCAFGDIAVTPNQAVSYAISTAGVATLVVGGVTMLTANNSLLTVAGTASINAAVTNGNAFSGGAGANGRGGASSGSPLGTGFSATSSNSGCGWGGIGGSNGGGVGGAATTYQGGPGLSVPSSDPLLFGLNGLGGNRTVCSVTADTSQNGGPGGGGGGAFNSAGSVSGRGGTGGFGAGGGIGDTAGNGGFGGGGGASIADVGGSGGIGGGGAYGSVSDGVGGPGAIRIYY